MPFNLCAGCIGRVSWCLPDTYPSSGQFYTLFSWMLQNINCTWTMWKKIIFHLKTQVVSPPSSMADEGNMRGISSVLIITLRFRLQIYLILYVLLDDSFNFCGTIFLDLWNGRRNFYQINVYFSSIFNNHYLIIYYCKVSIILIWMFTWFVCTLWSWFKKHSFLSSNSFVMPGIFFIAQG